MWMEASRIETLVPLQRDRWKRKFLKKAANLGIAYWLEHNRISRRCVWKGEVANILMTMMPQEALEQADNSIFAKIIRAQRTTIQDGCTDAGVNDLAEKLKNLGIK